MYETPEMLMVMVQERQAELRESMQSSRWLSDRTSRWLGRLLRRADSEAPQALAGDDRLAA